MKGSHDTHLLQQSPEKRTAHTVNTMKIFVAIAFILIIASLGSALVFLMKDKSRSKRTMQALAFRVGFSVALFILILLANYFGYIQPTGLPIMTAPH